MRALKKYVVGFDTVKGWNSHDWWFVSAASLSKQSLPECRGRDVASLKVRRPCGVDDANISKNEFLHRFTDSPNYVPCRGKW